MKSDEAPNRTILSILPREIRDQIWLTCIVDGSEMSHNGRRRISLCTADCKEPGSCFPYDFFGPVCTDQESQIMKQKIFQHMTVLFTCKQMMAEAGSCYRRIFTFTFNSAQCLAVFSAVLGRERLAACVSKFEVMERLKPCIPGNDRRLTAWRGSVEKNVESIVAVYYNKNTREAAWTCRSRCHAVDPLNGVYLCKISLSQQY